MPDPSGYALPWPAADPMSVCADALELRAEPFPNVIGLRIGPASPAHRLAAQALGLDLDAPVNHATHARGRAALRLGPDEWLIDTGTEESGGVAATLSRALDGQHAAVVDLSDGMSAFDIRGACSVDLLRKGCGLDLHPVAFGACRASRTSFAQATVVLRCIAAPDAWRLYADRSFAAYVWAWLRDAGREFLEVGA